MIVFIVFEFDRDILLSRVGSGIGIHSRTDRLENVAIRGGWFGGASVSFTTKAQRHQRGKKPQMAADARR